MARAFGVLLVTDSLLACSLTHSLSHLVTITVTVVLVRASERAPHVCQNYQLQSRQNQNVVGNGDCKFKYNLQNALESFT